MLKIFEKYASPFKLHKAGIMGMNKRNNHYIGRYNQRHLFPLVDNKLKTKKLAQQAGASVPDLIGVIGEQHGVPSIHDMVRFKGGFVIKPAQGSGGKGILVITANKEGIYQKPSGTVVTHNELERHITNILAGLFSLGGKNDVAVVESIIEFDNVFDDYSYEGVPDVRVIVFLGYPVMAMMRLSTAASDGKANLHQGAIGVGIDISNGHALRAVQFNTPVERHPDTGKQLSTLKVPHWQSLLTLAVSAWEMTNLGYLGADMVLDKNKGPMVLELNARPGLSIQIANGAGLLPRLRHIEHLVSKNNTLTPTERVAYAMEHFYGTYTPTLK